MNSSKETIILINCIISVRIGLSITIVSTILQEKTNYNYLKLAEQIDVYNNTSNNTISTLTKAYIGAGLSQGKAKAMSLSKIVQMVQGQSTIDAMAYSVSVLSDSFNSTYEEQTSAKKTKQGR